jgi:enoyl-CoA hydratase/carnithine racemase
VSTTDGHLLIDGPAVGVRRLASNRPEARNALDSPLRGAIFDGLHEVDRDDTIHVGVAGA